MIFRLHRIPIVVALTASAMALAGCAGLPPFPGVATDAAQVVAAATAGAIAATTAAEGVAPKNAAPGAAPAGSAAAMAAAAAAAAVAAQGPKPFADVIKDAKELPGLFRLYQKDDKVWIEIAPEQFDHPFFLTSDLTQGIGENRLFAGMMTYPVGVSQVVAFHKLGSNVQLIAKNVKYTARANTPEARAVAIAFSDSLLSSAPVVSQPHPDRKSVLIDANGLLLADIPGAAAFLDRTYRQSYAFDARNSSFAKVRATPDMVTFAVSAHYALARVVVPQAHGSIGAPELPSTLPDIRSLFLGYLYSLAKLPDEPMLPRLADDRIGYFTTERFDYTGDTPRVPINRYINRWRLEKKDPNAEVSEPKQPIVYWLDRTIPERYRNPIRDGILEWNKAFEKIGVKDAIRVEVQPDDADFDTSDLRHASVRWMTTARTAFGAIGPSVVDPRSGEILDADIGIDANNVRAVRNLRAEFLPPPAAAATLTPADSAYCAYGTMAAEEAGFALDLLEARGEIESDSLEADGFVDAYLKNLAMHEVGHTLGLTHNFRASTIYTQAQLDDPEFTRTHGISGSVMEYNPWNIALDGAQQGLYQMASLGPYDYWAIEYGYRESPPERETQALAQIAARSGERELAFASDPDASAGLDPQINTMDLGSDPLAYADKRLKLVRELWRRTEGKQLKPGDTYSVLRRNFMRGLNEASAGVVLAAKYIGGLTTLREHAGGSHAPLEPVPADKQRAALKLLATQVFAADSFKFSPELLRRMSVSPFDIEDAGALGRPRPTIDVAVDQQVLVLQRSVLDLLMSETTAQRLLNNEAKVGDPRAALKLSDLYDALHASVWSELKAGGDIPLVRRNLQREHATRIATALIRPSASIPADARALLRADAKALRAELAAAQGKAGYSKEAKAHIAETLSTLDEALKAPLQRQGV